MARLLGPLEEQPWLDQVGDWVAARLDPLFGSETGARAKDFLNGRWLGHSLHAVSTDLPVGLWAGSLLLDLVGLARSATVVNMFGCAAAVGSAASGLADWSGTQGRERRLGTLHGILNLAGLGFQVMSIGARLRRRRIRGFTLSLTGYSFTAAAGFMGGELVFGRGQMVNHNAFTAGPQSWTAIADATDLSKGQARAFALEGRKVLVFSDGTGIHALENACTHAGGPLDEGTVAGGIVTCPWHGSRFRLTDGAVCGGPATQPQLRLEARVKAGKIEVRGRLG